MKKILMSVTLLIGSLINTQGYAANATAEQLLSKDCSRCHNDSVYKERPNRRIHSLPALGKQVRFCLNPANAKWFDDEIKSVVKHLNTNYYKFK